MLVVPFAFARTLEREAFNLQAQLESSRAASREWVEALRHMEQSRNSCMSALRKVLDDTSAALCHVNTEHPAFRHIKQAHYSTRAAIARAEGRT